jgi:hypothetical protein
MPILNINGQIIDAPDTGDSPNWAPAMIEFMLAVESALAIAINQYDVPPQVFSIDGFNGATTEIANLIFPPTVVRACTIFFSVWRKTSITEVVETGQLEIRNNAGMFTITRVGSGDAFCDFTIDNSSGQVSLTLTTIPGVSHQGNVTYRALALSLTA